MIKGLLIKIKRFAVAISAVVISITFSGCEKDSFCNCLQNTGANASETRALSAFNSIEMNQNVDIIVRKGTEPKVVVTAGKNLLDGVRTKVENGKLYITNENKCNWLRDFKNKFTVEVYYQDLFFLTTRGSGNFGCADTINSAEFQVDNWNGSGTINLILNCNEARFKLHTGPADINASGTTEVLYVYTAGNGYVRAAALESEYTYITTKSTGDTEVQSAKELEAIIEYQGDVYYKGNPPIVRPVITGSGKLLPL